MGEVEVCEEAFEPKVVSRIVCDCSSFFRVHDIHFIHDRFEVFLLRDMGKRDPSMDFCFRILPIEHHRNLLEGSAFCLHHQ